jgi:uncharacterized membrane protein YjjP (DUF1212 family)
MLVERAEETRMRVTSVMMSCNRTLISSGSESIVLMKKLSTGVGPGTHPGKTI